MRLLTNPGSNLDEDLTISKDIELVPQKIIVDGIPHDTRNTIDFAQVDGWVKRAHKHPAVLGTTEQDFLDTFTRLAAKDPELLVVLTSRKIISTFDAATAAVRKLAQSPDPKLKAARVELVDSGMTDVGAGLVTLAAAQARKAGLSLKDAAAFTRAFAARNQNLITVATLDNLIKGGRANFLQAWVANFFNIRPMISFIDGALESVGRMNAKGDLADKADEYFSTRVDPKKPVWLGVAHGNVPDKAKAVAARLQQHFTVEYTLLRPVSPSIYLHGGPGSMAVIMLPLDGLAFRPTPP